MRLINSVDFPDHIPPVNNTIIFQELTKKFDPVEVLERPFFLGIVVYESECDAIGKVIVEPALTEQKIRARLLDERFCSKCFLFEIHDFKCEKSPWKNFTK